MGRLNTAFQHSHPSIPIPDQPAVKGQPDGIAATMDPFQALKCKIILDYIPCQFKSIFKCLDEPLFLQLVEISFINELPQLSKGFFEIIQTLLPADTLDPGSRLLQ